MDRLQHTNGAWLVLAILAIGCAMTAWSWWSERGQR